jgi:hypothetical protein
VIFPTAKTPNYSNTDYLVLGQLIEKVTRQSAVSEISTNPGATAPGAHVEIFFCQSSTNGAAEG